MFSSQLKFYRNLFGITQQEIANKLKISRQCYSGYEQGTREPTIETIKKLCIIFNCSADELLEIDSEEQRKKILKSIESE